MDRLAQGFKEMGLPGLMDKVVERNRELLLLWSMVGIRKYGVALSDDTLSEEELLQHAIEEALDLANYLQTLRMKLRGEL